MREPVTIVGGGLAGLSLGIGLRQRDVPVTIWEAGRYPRHRVCGEFISGEGQGVLARLGLLQGLRNAGVAQAQCAAFFAGTQRVATHALPTPALCISRHVLDGWLAAEFQRWGGELHTGVRWLEAAGPGIVRATGRRVHAGTDGWRWFGLKAHARGMALCADIEVHFIPAGYVGLCRLPGDTVNVCGLFRTSVAVPDLAERWRDWLGGPPDSELHSRLEKAEFVHDSFCSVAGLNLESELEASRGECAVGDAVTMIPPVTGNGMSMAFESAEMAIGPLAEYSSGTLDWTRVEEELARAYDHRFAGRLRRARWLQRALFMPPVCSALFCLAAHSDWSRRRLFASTR